MATKRRYLPVSKKTDRAKEARVDKLVAQRNSKRKAEAAKKKSMDDVRKAYDRRVTSADSKIVEKADLLRTRTKRATTVIPTRTKNRIKRATSVRKKR